MKHKFYFSGMSIDLDQTDADVMKDMQAAIDALFPTTNNYAKVVAYKELNADAFELEIMRRYASGNGMALGGSFICDHDESLLTGFRIDVFQPFKAGCGLVAPMIPWYDNMVYTPGTEFMMFWKQLNEVMTGERVKKIKLSPAHDSISVKVMFD